MKPVTGKFLKTGIFLILTAIVAVIFILWQQSNHYRRTAAFISHTNEVLYQTQKVMSAVTENKIIVRNYLLTGDQAYLTSLRVSNDSINRRVHKLQVLTADNPSQQRRIDSLQGFISKTNFSSDSFIELRNHRGPMEAIPLIREINDNRYAELTRQTIHAIEDEESHLLTLRKEANESSAISLDNMLLWLVIIVLVLVGFIIHTVRNDFLVLRKAEKALGEREEQLNLVLSNVSDYGIFTTDTEGIILSWNKGAERISGYHDTDVLGRHISLFYTPEQIAGGEPTANLTNARLNGRHESEAIRLRKDGTPFWANIVYTALYNEKQQLKGFAKIIKDITGQKKKQEEIRYLSRLVEQANEAIFSTDTAMIVKTWNKAAEQMYGYTAEEAIGSQLGQLLRSRMSEEIRKDIYQQIVANGSYQGEHVLTRKDGEPVTVLASLTTIREEDGSSSGFVIVHKDITERKMLEEQLVRFNEELERQVSAKTGELTGMLERISDAFVALDKDWNYTYINKKAAELIKRDPATLIGKNVWAEFPEAIGSATYELFHTAMREQQFMLNTDYFAPLDLWQENHVYPSPDGISVFIKDITEKRRAETAINQYNERFQIVTTATNDVIWDWDLASNALWWNQHFYTHFGYLPAEGTETIASRYRNIHPDDKQRVVEGIEAAIRNGDKRWSAEYRYLKADGTAVPVLDRGYIMHDPHGKPYRMAGAMVDLTGIRKAEEKIIYSEKRFRALLENSADGLMLTSADGVVQDITQTGARILGYSKEKYEGSNRETLMHEMIHPEDISLLQETFNSVIQKPGKIILLHYRFKKDGSYRWLECSYHNLLHEPYVNAVVLNFRDITERKKTEEKIRQNEQALSRAQEIGQIGSWEFDAITKELKWSDELYKIYGVGKSVTPSLDIYFGLLHPEDREKRIRMFENLGQREQRISNEFRFIRGTNELRYASAVIDVIFHNGQFRKVVGVVQDITERKKAEEKIYNNEKRFRALLENSADGLSLLSPEGKVIDISPSGTRILGYKYRDLVAVNGNGLIHPDDMFSVMHAFADVRKRPAGTAVTEHRHKMPDGSYKWLECSYHNLLHEPYVNAIVLNYRDITDRKNAAEKVRLNEQMLMRAQEIGQFGSWEYDALTQEITWSDSMYKIHGLSKDNPITLEVFFSHLYPPDVQKVKNVFRTLQAKEQRLRDEYRFLKNGEIRFAQTTIDAVFENGQFRKAMGVIIDITDIKHAEEVLRQSEARYRRAQAQGRLGHWELDLFSSTLLWSDEIYRMFEIPVDTKASLYDLFFELVHPDERQMFTQQLNETLKYNRNLDVVHRVLLKNGTTRFIHAVAELVKDEHGQPASLAGMVQDVTEQQLAEEDLRRSEHKYRLLFENNPMPMWMTAIPGQEIIDVNASALKQYGYTRLEFLQLNGHDLRITEEEGLFAQQGDAGIAAGSTVQQWRQRRKDGSIITVEVFNNKLMYEGRMVMLTLAVDITEKTRAELLLKKSYADIRELATHLQNIREEERTHIAREIHDELGQQLTGLKMDISWLGRKKDLTEQQRDHKIKDILVFIDGTVNTVRRLSAELRPGILDDLGLVEALEWWSKEFEKRSAVPCSFERPEKPVQVPANVTTGLFRIYQESLTNVARHAGATQVVSSLSASGGKLILKITDNGKGFDTANSGRKKTLGLLGMKERTQIMGGSYDISSQPGKGTTVTITVPFDNEQDS